MKKSTLLALVLTGVLATTALPSVSFADVNTQNEFQFETLDSVVIDSDKLTEQEKATYSQVSKKIEALLNKIETIYNGRETLPEADQKKVDAISKEIEEQEKIIFAIEEKVGLFKSDSSSDECKDGLCDIDLDEQIKFSDEWLNELDKDPGFLKLAQDEQVKYKETITEIKNIYTEINAILKGNAKLSEEQKNKVNALFAKIDAIHQSMEDFGNDVEFPGSGTNYEFLSAEENKKLAEVSEAISKKAELLDSIYSNTEVNDASADKIIQEIEALEKSIESIEEKIEKNLGN